jgi:hypothetical protein
MLDTNTTKETFFNANTVKNNLKQTTMQSKIQTTNQPTMKHKIEQKMHLEPKQQEIQNYKSTCCNCYDKSNNDVRCCGACVLYPNIFVCNDKTKNCNECCSKDPSNSWCFINPEQYFNSGCFLTSSGYGSEPEWCCTLFAGIVLGKFALTFPFLLCSILNCGINCCCCTERNYFF